MKNLLTDMIGLVGMSSICYGIYLQYGEAITYIIAGALLMIYAVLLARGK